MMATPLQFDEAARLPHPDDNTAIATRTLNVGTRIAFGGELLEMRHTVLVGHRFAVRRIHQGGLLTSWMQPFGTATAVIEAGDYVRNESVLRELRHRSLDFDVPLSPNFTDQIPPFVFDEARFVAAPLIDSWAEAPSFDGYHRGGSRGVGTRNVILLLGTSSLAAGFVQALEARLKPLAERFPNIDGIVAVAHTEGGQDSPNNLDLVLRTLAGFIVHPNVGAVLAVDQGDEAANNAALAAYMAEHGYPLADVTHHFLSLSGSFEQDQTAAAEIVSGWLETVNGVRRAAAPLSALKIALQCGGSDAFSGISGNPLAAWVAREIVRGGGAANLAETDELIGAEQYMVSRVRDLETARKFLYFIERFKTWTGWHGHSAEGNPSGGNIYRGLYNIYLKSLGASAKRHPDVRLDYAIDYGEPMRHSGFYFMDSPGNDLESIAGQVASGCNLIFFVTGNGSITNFPFVPTIKIVTTSERYHLLPAEMDVNAGAYLEDTPMEALGAATLDLAIKTASGALTAGEKAAHAQVQIWRNWSQTAPAVVTGQIAPAYSGQPHLIAGDGALSGGRYTAFRTGRGMAAQQVGLILPTSLCSGQIARMCAERLNASGIGRDKGLSRFVALVHTEGCGSTSEAVLLNVMTGYLKHPFVRHALLLEHGCEKTHNGYFREYMAAHGLDPQDYGWASVQLDGGIHRVTDKIVRWFSERIEQDDVPSAAEVNISGARIAIVTRGNMSDASAEHLARLTRLIAAGGGTVVVSSEDALLNRPAYKRGVLGDRTPSVTLGFGQAVEQDGFHIMAAATRDWNELLTGIGASGVELILAHTEPHPMPGHPMIPVLQVTSSDGIYRQYYADFDALIGGTDGDTIGDPLIELIAAALGRQYLPRASAAGNTQFQITRGLLGVSL